MPGKTIHVVPHGEDWAVVSEKSSRPSRVIPTKQEALNIGRQQAQNNKGELVIHGKDGVIQNKNSFGNDPCPPKDKVH
jgi:hypothetical protein